MSGGIRLPQPRTGDPDRAMVSELRRHGVSIHDIANLLRVTDAAVQEALDDMERQVADMLRSRDSRNDGDVELPEVSLGAEVVESFLAGVAGLERPAIGRAVESLARGPSHGIAIGALARCDHDYAIALGRGARTVGPGTLVVAWGDPSVQVVFHADGRVDLPEGMTVNEAGRGVWAALGEVNPARLEASRLTRQNAELLHRLERIVLLVQKGTVGREELDQVARLAGYEETRA